MTKANHSSYTTRQWVLYSTDTSIAEGKVSVLAVLEVFFAISLYGWIASYFHYPLICFVGLFSAPLLLLRSPESIETGVKMLEQYWSCADIKASRVEIISLSLIILLFNFLSFYEITTHWILMDKGWSLFLKSVVLGSFLYMGTLVCTLVSLSPGKSTGTVRLDSAVIGAMVGFGVGLFAGMMTVLTETLLVKGFFSNGLFPKDKYYLLIITFIGLAVGLLANSTSYEFIMRLVGKDGGLSNTNTSKSMLSHALEQTNNSIPLFFAVWLRSLFIRWWATLCHLSAGLRNMPQNWHDCFYLTDFVRSPELLPNAGQVELLFTGRGVLQKLRLAPFFLMFLVPILYIPAIAYRWSLKASAFIWWPLALALTPPLAARERAAITTSGAWRILLLVPCVVSTWLVLSEIPDLNEVLSALPSDVKILAKSLSKMVAPPPNGLRYSLIVLAILLSLILWWLSRDFKATHAKALESPKEYRDLDDEEKKRFDFLARRIDCVRTCFIVTLIFLGEAIVLSFYSNHAPQKAADLFGTLILSWL